jgi:hypothetical protein
MKLTDVVNERLVKKARLIKRAKTVFKAFKKGTIGSNDNPTEPMFSYELLDDVSMSINEMDTVSIFSREIKIKELNDACRYVSVVLLVRKITKRCSGLR